MKRTLVALGAVAMLAGCGSFSEGVEDGASGGNEQRFENAARGKDTSGGLNSLSGDQLVDLGNGVCLRLSTPKPGTESDESVAEVKADPPGDLQGQTTAWNALVDAAVQELCFKE